MEDTEDHGHAADPTDVFNLQAMAWIWQNNTYFFFEFLHTTIRQKSPI
jgi:hypothetical protein